MRITHKEHDFINIQLMPDLGVCDSTKAIHVFYKGDCGYYLTYKDFSDAETPDKSTVMDRIFTCKDGDVTLHDEDYMYEVIAPYVASLLNKKEKFSK